MELKVVTLFGETSTVSIGEPETKPSPKQTSGQDKRVFGITNMLFAGDKKGMWIEYRKLINEGYAPDELFAPLWWGIKSILFTKKGISGVAPYTTGQISRGLSDLTLSLAYDIALSFLEMVTSVRTIPNMNTEIQAEKWILSLPFK